MKLLGIFIVSILLISAIFALIIAAIEKKRLSNGKLKAASEDVNVEFYKLYEIHFISFLLLFTSYIAFFYVESLIISFTPMSIFIKIYLFFIVDYLWEQKQIRKIISSEKAFLSTIILKILFIVAFSFVLTIIKYSMIW